MSVIIDPERKFDYTVPVAVVGAGACGFTAALAARDAGVDVLVLERDKRPWGSTSMSLGAMCAAASAEHARHGIDDTPQRFYDDVMAKTGGRADPLLARTVAEESGPAVDWLTTAHGVPLLLDFKWTGLGHSRPRLHIPPGRNGEELLALLGNAAERAGAQLMTEAHVTDLYADDHGRVTGLRIARPGGAFEEVGTDAVVLACCGFAGNHAMVAREIPEMANARYFGHEGNRGEGIEWGRELGAALGDMTAYQGLGTLADPQQVIVPHPLLLEGGILVNVEGRRFTHENANISGMCVPVLAQPQGLAWVVFDERLHQACREHSVEQRQLEEIGAIRRASTVDGLERLCQLPTGALAAELEAVAAARAARRPDRFDRRFDDVAPLSAPFCAIRVTGALFHTQGGLVVDRSAQVLRPDGSALPNLFAGGGVARSISGSEVTGYLPGAGLCMAITLGRLAGRGAAHVALERGSIMEGATR
jgi:fumarate reductase flavoprotein subunit